MFAAIRLASSLVRWRKTKTSRGILERLRRIDQRLAPESHQRSVRRGARYRPCWMVARNS
jgi:hypothetical protein